MDEHKIAKERAEIEAQVTGRTWCDVLDRNADDHPDEPAASWRDGQRWHTLTWQELRAQAVAVAAGLADLGVERGDFVALMMANRPEHVIADQATAYLGAVPTTLYGTLAEEQIEFCAGHCGAKVAIVDDVDVARRWAALRTKLPALQHLVVVTGTEEAGTEEAGTEEASTDDSGWPDALTWTDLLTRGRARLSADESVVSIPRSRVAPDDPVTVVYTSGTTGPPKGVILTHHNLLYECAALDRIAELPDGLTAVSYLPLAHIAERLNSVYFNWLWKRGHVWFCPVLTEVFDYVRRVRPLTFAGVPRVWEKLWSGLIATIDAAPQRRRGLAYAAITAGRAVARHRDRGEPIPPALRLRHAVLDRLVLRKIRAALGLDRATNLASGAAPLAVEVAESLAALGLPILEVYGMTETAGVATANRRGDARIATVGPPLPGVELKLGPDDEILLRGPITTPGYYRDPAGTATLLDPDGWLHTGDIGSVDDSGHVRIVDRKKELIITAGGKNVSPANIENLLKEHPLVGQALVYGDARPYLVALIVLDPETAPGWARQHGLSAVEAASLANTPEVVAAVCQAVGAVNQRLSRPEQVKRVAVLPTEWTPEGGELTPTMKLRRAGIRDKYASDIDGLYAGTAGQDITPATA